MSNQKGGKYIARGSYGCVYRPNLECPEGSPENMNEISKIIPNLDQNIEHKEIGTPKSHWKFLGRYEGSYGPIPNKKLFGLLPMPFNTTKIKNLYCVGDSCFPGQGLNAVAFSGYACAHKIGSKLNINSFTDTLLILKPYYSYTFNINTIDYVQIMSTGNALDFGDMNTNTIWGRGGCSNGHGGLG